MKCKLITTASDLTHPGYLNLVRSLDKYGWDYDVLNSGYDQFGTKMVNAYNYAKTTDCTHLFIVDAYDVLAFGSMEEALIRILDKDVILFGAEINAWPFEQWAYLYPPAKSRFKYLNGGVAFVSVERFCRMFEDNPITTSDNDQVLLAKAFLTRRSEYNMKLDTDCNVFQNLCGTAWEDFEFTRGRIWNKETGTIPALVHGNGRHPMDKLIEMI